MPGIHVRCREARKLIDLSQEGLAAELGVSRGAIAQWEMREGTWPSVENLSALARRSGMAFEYLATGRGPKLFGDGIAESPKTYAVEAETPEERELLDRFRGMRASRRSALLELLRA
jgi:transcriptional regulator with XRE-family HTH domain